jgi:hypothetical protein
LRLERQAKGRKVSEVDKLSDYELLAWLCGKLGGDVSKLSHTAEEAYGKGYDCWMAELAALVGVELAELNAALERAATGEGVAYVQRIPPEAVG